MEFIVVLAVGILVVWGIVALVSSVDGAGRYNTKPVKGQFKRDFNRALYETNLNGTMRDRSVSDEVKSQVWFRDDHKCQDCGTESQPDNPLVFDFIKPFSQGGTSDVWNIQLLCQSCAVKKRINLNG